ncbi:MAG: response regulator [Thermoplasmatota archaeon]
MPRRILFVDDDQGLLDQAKYVLEKENEDFEVIPAQSADEALERLNKNGLDIVVSDYKMPGMDGLELLKKLREKGNDIPFIIFTGKGREKIAMRALNLGADRYFRKGGDPISQYEVLTKAIEQEIHRKATERSHEDLKKELKNVEKKYETIFENIRYPLLVIDETGEIQLANEGFQKLSNYSKEDLIGKKDWFQFVSEEDVSRVKKMHDLRNIDEKLSQKGYKFDFLGKYGNTKPLYAALTKIPNNSETMISLFDISDFDNVVNELIEIEQVMIDQDFEEIKEHVQSISKELFDQESLRDSIKNWCLEEILLLLIQIKQGATGKELMSMLNDTFIIDLSSSIVYPKLHDLEENGILTVQEHIRTKEYKIKDREEAKNKIVKKLTQLYGIYTILRLLDFHDRG